MTKKLTLILGLLMLTSLLSACAGVFQPKHKTIEYDEEVKLHNGDMIWVHITRHYRLAGELGGGTGYLPSTVEISWDTGFKGVGRKSVYFKESATIINKFNDKWYLTGRIANPSLKLSNSVNCAAVGEQVVQICVVSLNNQGEFVKPNIKDIYQVNRMNILHPIGIKNWGLFPKSLDGKKLTWNEKLSLEKQQNKDYQRLERSIEILEKMEKVK